MRFWDARSVLMAGKPHLVRGLLRRPGVRWTLVALGVYALTTLVMTYPVPFRLNSVIAGHERGDAYQYTWSLWWTRQAVLEADKGLAHLTLMNHPVGVEHPFMLTMVGVNLLALPFSLVLSPPVVYNLQVLSSFVLSGLAMYWLCTELSGDRKAGLLGGFIFAFFLNKTGHTIGGHLPQVTVYWLPLYVLFLWRAVRRPGWGVGLLAALGLVVACLIHGLHIVNFVLPVTIVTLVMAMTEMKVAFFTWQRLGSLALVFGLAALLTAPFLLPTVLHSVEDESYLYKVGTVDHSVDLLALFTPSLYHPVLRSLGLVPSFAERIFYDQEALYEGLAYPGVLALGLALWGLIRRGRKAWTWGMLALGAAVLSLGPLLKVGGELVLYRVDGLPSYIVLPYALLKQVPLLRVARTPGRLNETVMFSVAILASYGVAALSSQLARYPRLFTFVLLLLLVVVGFEYVAVWPFPVVSAEIPPTIRHIASEPGGGALLHILMKSRRVNHRALYYQTATQRPVVGGEVHRAMPDALPWSETVSGLAQPDERAGEIVPRPDAAERVAWLRYFDVDYVVFHTTENRDDLWYRDFAQTLLGPPRYEDQVLAAFAVPGDAPVPDSPHLYTLSRLNWHAPERDGDLWRRWMSDTAELYLYATREGVGSLRFAVDSPLEFPVLEVYLAEHPLDAVVVGQRTTYTTRPFTLTQGMNLIRFQGPEDCPLVVDDPRCWGRVLLSPPADDGRTACDPDSVHTTCRTFIFDQMSFVPQEDLPEGDGLDVSFGGQMRLRAWHLNTQKLSPGGVLSVTLAWEPEVELSDQYVVFVHLLDPDGALVAQHDAPPAGKRLPFSAWPPGATFTYPVTVELPGDLSPGDYRLLVGIYLWPSLERLPLLTQVTGAENGAMLLTRLQIEP